MNNVFYEAIRDYTNEIYEAKGSNYCESHFHQQIEIIYVIEGELDIYINNVHHVLKKHQLAIIDSFETHKYIYNEKSISHVLLIPIQYLKKFNDLTQEKKLLTNIIEDEKISNDLYKAMQKVIKNINKNTILKDGYINVLLGKIVETIPLISDVRTDFNLIKKILLYIEENYSNDINLEKIAYQFGYNKYYFSKLFNDTFKCNLNEYLNMVRCRYVVQLKEMEEISFSECAYRCGFETLRTFYRSFKKVYQMTPSEYFANR